MISTAQRHGHSDGSRLTAASGEMGPTSNGWRYALITVVMLIYGAIASFFLVSRSLVPDDRTLVEQGTAADQITARLQGLTDPEREVIAARERAILGQQLLDVLALKNLAVLAQLSGDQKTANALALTAGDRNLRDVATQAVVLQNLLAAEDYSGALRRYDGLMRARPEDMDKLLPGVAAFAHNPAALPSLISLLASDPPWRARFIRYLVESDKDDGATYQLFTALGQVGSPVTAAQLGALVQRMIRNGNVDRAYYVWLDALTETELRKVGLVYDGDFDGGLKGRSFDWTNIALPNIDVVTAPRAAGSTDQVLRLNFAPGSVAFAHVYQYLRLSPGSYRLTGETKAENLETSNGLVWRIYCVQPQLLRIATSPHVKGSENWAPFEQNFTVPDSECSTQLLRLELDAPAKLDQQISGRASYDVLKITVASSPAGASPAPGQ